VAGEKAVARLVTRCVHVICVPLFVMSLCTCVYVRVSMKCVDGLCVPFLTPSPALKASRAGARPKCLHARLPTRMHHEHAYMHHAHAANARPMHTCRSPPSSSKRSRHWVSCWWRAAWRRLHCGGQDAWTGPALVGLGVHLWAAFALVLMCGHASRGALGGLRPHWR